MKSHDWMMALCLCSSLYGAAATASDSLEDALLKGTPTLEMRYRYEFADKADLPKNAHASTLRTRFGYRTGEYKHFSAMLEGQDIREIGSDRYNNTINGRTQYPTVADVESTRINQAFVQSTYLPDTKLIVGRETLNIDNQRFIGSGEWRQENQTMDTFNLTNTSLPDTTLFYGYLDNINRIFGEHSSNGTWETDSHLFNIQNNSLKIGTITPYAYLLDIKDSPANSTQTYGVSLVGKQPLNDTLNVTYRAEGANQQDYGNSPLNFNAQYTHLNAGLGWKGLQTTLGYEYLGSDNGKAAFGTPLASLHAFNGWADVFTTTPLNGLQDRYLDVTYTVDGSEGLPEWSKGALLRGQLHSFASARSNDKYGNELGLYVQVPVTQNGFVEAKYANYQADGYSTDIQRATMGVGVKF